MTRYTITLPLEDNAHVSTATARRVFEDALLGIAGGFSTVAVEGAWIDETVAPLYRDSSVRYEILLQSDAATHARLIAIANRACRDCNQLAVLFTFERTTAHFLKG